MHPHRIYNMSEAIVPRMTVIDPEAQFSTNVDTIILPGNSSSTTSVKRENTYTTKTSVSITPFSNNVKINIAWDAFTIHANYSCADANIVYIGYDLVAEVSKTYTSTETALVEYEEQVASYGDQQGCVFTVPAGNMDITATSSTITFALYGTGRCVIVNNVTYYPTAILYYEDIPITITQYFAL